MNILEYFNISIVILGTIQKQGEEVDLTEGVDAELKNIIEREKELKRVKHILNSNNTTSNYLLKFL